MAARKTDRKKRASSPESSSRRERVVLRSPSFTKLYATNVLVRHTDVDFRIDFFNEKMHISEKEMAYVSEAIAILTPEAAKILLETLQRELSLFEEAEGAIGVSKVRSRGHAAAPRPARRA